MNIRDVEELRNKLYAAKCALEMTLMHTTPAADDAMDLVNDDLKRNLDHITELMITLRKLDMDVLIAVSGIVEGESPESALRELNVYGKPKQETTVREYQNRRARGSGVF